MNVPFHHLPAPGSEAYWQLRDDAKRHAARLRREGADAFWRGFAAALQRAAPQGPWNWRNVRGSIG